MRLSSIKLAGFKSFVDPVSVAVPGRLVAVVGPNGCGKSNIIDAVRWVLGESSAKQLRGESMQDVIFNGSTGRKPVSRASVELTFSNLEGKLTGSWGQYAEVAIKRVLTRGGDSSYYINNQAVRRRDITDLFLGTGVGARGYAVIEQGMISRIIEASPEALREYLEEAAGISKYKERRRETERRLLDARDNLARLEDVRIALVEQVERLTLQAAVARNYQQLQADLLQTQHLIAWLRQQEALQKNHALSAESARLQTALDAEIAQLRAVEAELEIARESHFAAGDAVQDAQAKLFEVNAGLARLEQQIHHQRDLRTRIQAQIDQATQACQKLAAQWAATRTELATQAEAQAQASEALTEALITLEVRRDALIPAENDVTTHKQMLETQVAAWQSAVQAGRVVSTGLDYSNRQRQPLQARLSQLQQQIQALPAELNAPDEAAVLHADIAREQAAAALDAAVMLEAETQAAWQQADTEVRRLEREEMRLASDLDVQEKLLAAAAPPAALSRWLSEHGADEPVLWQSLQITAGWEVAVAATLREALSARKVATLPALAEAVPPGRLAVYQGGGDDAAADNGVLNNKNTKQSPYYSHFNNLRSMLDVISAPPEARAALATWLHQVYVADDAAFAAVLAQPDWPHGVRVVNRLGHCADGQGLRLHAADPASEVTTRQAECVRLRALLAPLQTQLTQERARLQASAQARETSRRQADTARSQVATAERQFHLAQLAVREAQQKMALLSTERRQLNEAHTRIQDELAVLSLQCDTLAQQHEDNVEIVDLAHQRLEASRETARTLEQHLHHLREAERQAERAAQTARHHASQLENRTAELGRLAENLSTQHSSQQQQRDTAQAEYDAIDDTALHALLDGAVATREAAERALREARETAEAGTRHLRSLDEARLRTEQAQQPLRDQIQQVNLQAQEARLIAEQFTAALGDADITAIAAHAHQQHAKLPSLLRDQQRLLRDIEALGAVNLVALQELEATEARRAYLDAQALDLNTAIETLESAIRRIDRETRARLADTFERVNASLAELFPLLFGGGQAKLTLTGEEILDAGILLMAQPPGKKNSSLALLSGGEKALTALALVFSLFQLNPAPFCLLDEVDAPLDDANTVRFCEMVKKMSAETQFLYISHNKITMEMAAQLVGITMHEQGVSRVVAVDVEAALRLQTEPV